VSERRACQVLDQSRSTQRRQPQVASDEPRLVRRIVELATQYGRYGYRSITALLQRERCGSRLTSEDVLERLTDLFIRRGVPDYIRSDNGVEFTAHAVRDWLVRVGVRTLYIEPGSPWENGYIESFNGKLRDELLEREIFDTILEAKVLIERWRQEYNTIRPHSSLGYRPPAPEAVQPWSSRSAALQLQTTAEEQDPANSNLNTGIFGGGRSLAHVVQVGAPALALPVSTAATLN